MIKVGKVGSHILTSRDAYTMGKNSLRLRRLCISSRPRPARQRERSTVRPTHDYLPVGKEGSFGCGTDSLEEVLCSDEPPFSTPSFLAVSRSSLPVSLSPLAFWNALIAWCVCGPKIPSIEPGSCPLFFSASWAFLTSCVAHLSPWLALPPIPSAPLFPIRPGFWAPLASISSSPFFLSI
jgi:hypothetical protein